MGFPCMKKKPRTTVRLPSQPTSHPNDGKVRLGYGRGHNEKTQGADDYLGESEWQKYGPTRVGGKIVKKSAEMGSPSVLIDRPPGRSYYSQCEAVAEEAERLGVTHMILLHFNASSSRSSHGVETLILDTSDDQDNKFADHFSDILNEKWGIRERRDDGVFVVSKGHGGYGMLKALRKRGIVAVLIEPGFLGFDIAEARRIVENEDEFASIVAECGHLFVTQNLPPVD